MQNLELQIAQSIQDARSGIFLPKSYRLPSKDEADLGKLLAI